MAAKPVSASPVSQRRHGLITNRFNLMAAQEDNKCSRQDGPKCILRFAVSSNCEVDNQGEPQPPQPTQPTCRACPKCTDERLSALPDEPGSGMMDFVLGVDGAPLVRRSNYTVADNGSALLANEGGLGRTTSICFREVGIPSYNTYDRKHKTNNKYKPYYFYFQDGRIGCGKFHFELRETSADAPDVGYETEHVYEAQLLWSFMSWFAGPNGDKALVAKREEWDGSDKGKWTSMAKVCKYAYVPYLFRPYPRTTDQTMVQRLTAELPGTNSHAEEFVYLEASLNRMKGQMFKLDSPSLERSYQDKLRQLARIGLVFRYMAKEGIQTKWKATSARVRAFYHSMDKKGSQGQGLEKLLTWEDKYVEWERRYAVMFTKHWKEWRDKAIEAVEEQLEKEKIDYRVALQKAIDEEKSDDGLLSDATWTLRL